jgi:flagellar hook-associated protein 3 FlgL
LSSLTNVAEALELQYKERLSNLRDIDYAEVISAFTEQQTQLEAAQSSFAKISALSLFNYL